MLTLTLTLSFCQKLKRSCLICFCFKACKCILTYLITHKTQQAAQLTSLDVPCSDTAIVVAGHDNNVMCHNATISGWRWRMLLHYRTCYAAKLQRIHKRSDADCQLVVIKYTKSLAHGSMKHHMWWHYTRADAVQFAHLHDIVRTMTKATIIKYIMFSYMMYNSIRHHFFHMANKFDHQMRSAEFYHLIWLP